MQVKKQQLELDKEQQIGSKSGKGYIKAVYCLFDLYTEYIMQNVGLDEAQAGIKIRLPGKILVTSDMQITSPLWQKANRN